MNKVIISGAAGFTGTALTKCMVDNGIEVFALVRRGSKNNYRLSDMGSGVHQIEVDASEYDKIPDLINERCDCFFHLLWEAGKTVGDQMKNIGYALSAITAAAECGCKRAVFTGSQAEYGVVESNTIIQEDMPLKPITAYGAAKVAASALTRIKANELGIEWIWGRIFSLIGENEPTGRMLPSLYMALRDGREMSLSSCMQNWDYLDVHDAANALFLLGERGKSGEIYNIAHGQYKPLREYTEKLREMVSPNTSIRYGGNTDPYISLQPSVNKLKCDTGWEPIMTFEDSINDYSGT